jgi:hypothetical protein
MYSPKNIEGRIKFPTKLSYCNRLDTAKQATSEETDEVEIEGSPTRAECLATHSDNFSAQIITKKQRGKMNSYQHQRPRSLMDDLLDS